MMITKKYILVSSNVPVFYEGCARTEKDAGKWWWGSEWGLQTSQQKPAVYSASSEIQLEPRLRRPQHSTCPAEIET